MSGIFNEELESLYSELGKWNVSSLTQYHLHIILEHFDSPIYLGAKVTHGFKRGSKELGIPTANLCMDELGERGSIKTGIYYGVARLRNTIYQCVVSVGWWAINRN